MRVTNQMMSKQAIHSLWNTQDTLYRTQAQIASGRRLLLPCDDPAGAALASSLRATLARQEQSLANLDAATFWLAAAESNLQSVGNAVHDLRDIALRAGGVAGDQAALDALAASARSVYERLVQAGNAQLNGRYIFAGQAADTVPLVETGGDPPLSFAGSATAPAVPIGDGKTMDVGVTADRVFNLNGSVDAAQRDLFAVALALAQQLEAGDVAGVSAAIEEIDFHLAHVTALRGEIGTRAQTCEAAIDRLSGLSVETAAALSRVEDADMAALVVELAEQENAYQAAAAMAAGMGRASLLDYLR